MSQPYTPTPRTRLVREADRAVYDREAAYRILDEGFLCHVGFVADGQPFVIPTSYGRKDASLYIHGSAASRMLRQMKDGLLASLSQQIVSFDLACAAPHAGRWAFNVTVQTLTPSTTSARVVARVGALPKQID